METQNLVYHGEPKFWRRMAVPGYTFPTFCFQPCEDAENWRPAQSPAELLVSVVGRVRQVSRANERNPPIDHSCFGVKRPKRRLAAAKNDFRRRAAQAVETTLLTIWCASIEASFINHDCKIFHVAEQNRVSSNQHGPNKNMSWNAIYTRRSPTTQFAKTVVFVAPLGPA